MARPPTWQLLLTAGVAAISVAAAVYHRDEPLFAGLHLLVAVASVACILQPRIWAVVCVVAVVCTFWGGWEWARIVSAWLAPESPLAYSPEDADVALGRTWQVTVITLWLNILLMMIWGRRAPGKPPAQRERA